jgi:hypothetical protein
VRYENIVKLLVFRVSFNNVILIADFLMEYRLIYADVDDINVKK